MSARHFNITKCIRVSYISSTSRDPH